MEDVEVEKRPWQGAIPISKHRDSTTDDLNEALNEFRVARSRHVNEVLAAVICALGLSS